MTAPADPLHDDEHDDERGATPRPFDPDAPGNFVDDPDAGEVPEPNEPA